jgi:hypothetical protein
MKRQPTTPGAQALADARRQAARELKLPVGDARVHQLAALIVAHNALQIKIAAGAQFSVTELMQLDGALKEARAKFTPHEPLRVDLILAETVTGICPLCNGEVPDYVAAPPSRPARPAPIIDGEVVAEAIKPPKALPAPAAAPSERPHPPGIHQQNGAACPPLDYSELAQWP